MRTHVRLAAGPPPAVRAITLARPSFQGPTALLPGPKGPLISARMTCGGGEGAGTRRVEPPWPLDLGRNRRLISVSHGVGVLVPLVATRTTAMTATILPPDVAGRRILAQDPGTAPEVLEALTRTNDPITLARVARNPNAPAPALDILAGRADNGQLENAIAAHPNTGHQALQYLAAARYSQPAKSRLAAHGVPEISHEEAADLWRRWSADLRVNPLALPFAGLVRAASTAQPIGGYCDNCGRALQAGASFCPGCGRPQPSSTAPAPAASAVSPPTLQARPVAPWVGPSVSQPSGYASSASSSTPSSTNGFAIASLVFGILWLFWLGSLLAVIFGHVAVVQTRKRGQRGRGLAIAGLVLGYIGVGIFLLIIVLDLAHGINPFGPAQAS